MHRLFERVRERKVVQWAVAYVAGAWLVVEVIDVLGDMFGVPLGLQRGVVIALGFGLLLTLVLAWYHGEKGRQTVSGPELILVACVLVMAGVTVSLLHDPTAEPGVASGPGEIRPDMSDAAPPDPGAIAVLPFADLSPDGDQGYLGDGIAEELLSVLSQIEGLRVASRTSSFSFRDRSVDVREIGASLGVASIIEGSVRKSGDRLRVEARLVSAGEGFRIWSDRFDTDASDIFAVQDSIALAVSSALQVRLSGNATELRLKGQTADPVAQDLYLKGRFAWNRRTQRDLEQAVEFFSQAVDRDPGYARALTGLGDAYAVLGFYDYRSPSEAFPLARDAARRALAVDSTMAEPHATLGYAALYYDWQWDQAERHFLRSIELDPGYPVAHQWYANHLVAMGRFEEAAREMRAASELDPLSMIAFAALGFVHLYEGEYRRAVQTLEEARARDPGFELAYLWGGQAHEALDELDRAESLIRRSVGLSGGSAISRAALARVVALRGREAEARRILSELEREGERGYVPSYELARAYVGLGELDTAVAWLERAYEERAHSIAFLGVDPQLRPLRGHPGYRELVERVGLDELG